MKRKKKGKRKNNIKQKPKIPFFFLFPQFTYKPYKRANSIHFRILS